MVSWPFGFWHQCFFSVVLPPMVVYSVMRHSHSVTAELRTGGSSHHPCRRTPTRGRTDRYTPRAQFFSSSAMSLLYDSASLL